MSSTMNTPQVKPQVKRKVRQQGNNLPNNKVKQRMDKLRRQRKGHKFTDTSHDSIPENHVLVSIYIDPVDKIMPPEKPPHFCPSLPYDTDTLEVPAMDRQTSRMVEYDEDEEECEPKSYMEAIQRVPEHYHRHMDYMTITECAVLYCDEDMEEVEEMEFKPLTNLSRSHSESRTDLTVDRSILDSRLDIYLKCSTTFVDPIGDPLIIKTVTTGVTQV